MNETNVMRKCMIKLSENKNTRVFRNNVGTAVAYDFKEKKIRQPIHIIKYGLCTGSSDLVGWKSVKITPEMVGTNVAIFTAIETKNPNKSKISDEQINFIDTVRDAGGIALVATSEKDVENI